MADPYIEAAKKKMNGEQPQQSNNAFLQMVAGQKMANYQPGATDWRGEAMPELPSYTQGVGAQATFQYQPPKLDQVDIRKDPMSGKTYDQGKVGGDMGAKKPASPGEVQAANKMGPLDYVKSIYGDKLKNGMLSLSGTKGGLNTGATVVKVDTLFDSPSISRAVQDVQNSKLNDTAKKQVLNQIIIQGGDIAKYEKNAKKAMSDKDYEVFKGQVSSELGSKTALF